MNFLTSEHLAWVNVICFVVMTGGLLYVARLEARAQALRKERTQKLGLLMGDSAGTYKAQTDLYSEYEKRLEVVYVRKMWLFGSLNSDKGGKR